MTKTTLKFVGQYRASGWSFCWRCGGKIPTRNTNEVAAGVHNRCQSVGPVAVAVRLQTVVKESGDSFAGTATQATFLKVANISYD